MKSDWKKDILAEIAADLEALEREGKAPKDIAELEQITIKMVDKTGKLVFERWMEDRAKKAHFSP
jgi:hypothetical protein